MNRDPLRELWENAEPITDEDFRKLDGDCYCCVEHGSLTPGVGRIRAIWVDADGKSGDDVVRVCRECVKASHGGPGYRPIDPEWR